MKIKLSMLCRIGSVAAITGAALVASLLAAPVAQAVGAGTNWPTLTSAVPAANTPDIANGTVFAITQVGSQIIVGGSFSSVAEHGSSTTVTRTDVLAFDASTGQLSTTFAPTLDGQVEAVRPGPTANTVYVGGYFNNVNGVKSKGVTLLDTQTGAIVSGFKPPALNGVVFSVASAGNLLFIAGTFTSAGGVHGGIASLNATTGTIDPFMNVQFAGHHNYNGSGANGAVGPRAIAVNPAGTRMMVVGNFKTADGLPRDQVAMIDLDGASAAVDPNWSTLQYTATCFSGSFDTYMTDVQYSADGSYFVVTATGGSGTNSDGSNSLCDTASRWESSNLGSGVKATWVDYTGQDSLWSVAITGTAIYVGGHQRWLNNSNGHDNPGTGAVPRPGLAALDPASGVPLAWNPGRNPRGAGAYAVFASPTGLYVGSDTDYIGNFRYKHQKLAYFPLAGGAAPASTATAQLPSNLYEAGQLPGSNNTNVLYRVDAGGPTVGAIDNGPDWLADGSDSDPGAQYRNTGSNTAAYSCCASLASTVPASTPAAIFNTERWDPGSKNDGGEMHWSFPVTAGMHVGVRLYFANRYTGTSQVGQRVFDVAVDGSTVLNNYDIVADVGDQTGTMKEFDVTSPGSVTIDLTHEVENPLINGIELIDLDKPAGGSSVGDLAYRAMSGSTIGPLTTVPNTGIDWSSTRGAFMAGNAIFYSGTDGNFYRASFDGTTVGTSTVVDPYDDPAWDNVQTGSGQTYQGTKPDFYGEMSSVTGAFYSSGRLYYSLLGQSALYSRWFSPDSGVIGSQEFTVGGADFSNIAGMVLSGTTLYYANRSDGTLHTIPFANGTPDGTQDTVVSGPSQDGNDWRSRGMFLYGSPSVPNQLPTARATSSCTGLSCIFDGTGSFDPDGTIASYAWDFGDGSHGTGSTPTHGYAQDGTYPVSLVVTDNRGGQSTAWNGQVTVHGTGVQVGYVAQAGFNGITANPSVVVPAAVSPGDTELLFVSAGTAGVTTTVPSGWQQIAQRTNSPLETTVFERVATAADAGSTVTVALAASSRVDVQLLDYSNVAGGTPVLATAADSNTASHVTPAVSVAAGGSWVVSYWADRTSNATSWTLPSGVSTRATSYGTGGGRVDAAVADSGSPVASGPYSGLTASGGVTSAKGATVSIVLAPATPNQLPTASATSSCTGLSCTFDGTGSFDPDGTIASYAWEFGDGTQGTDAKPTHGYAQQGTYNVSLVVTDNRGGQSTAWTGQVSVQPAAGAHVGFVAQAGFNGITASPSVVVPVAVSAGDTELLFVSAGTAGVTTAVPSGWQQIAQRTNSPLETTVFQRVATAADAGSTVTVVLAASARVDVQLLDYSGVAPGTPVLATAGDSTTASHVAPDVSVAAAGSWVVSYWADRTSGTTVWTLPSGVSTRARSYGTGGGRVDAAVADSGQPVSTGSYGTLTASSGVASGKGAMVSIVLARAS